MRLRAFSLQLFFFLLLLLLHCFPSFFFLQTFIYMRYNVIFFVRHPNSISILCDGRFRRSLYALFVNGKSIPVLHSVMYFKQIFEYTFLFYVCKCMAMFFNIFTRFSKASIFEISFFFFWVFVSKKFLLYLLYYGRKCACQPDLISKIAHMFDDNTKRREPHSLLYFASIFSQTISWLMSQCAQTLNVLADLMGQMRTDQYKQIH